MIKWKDFLYFPKGDKIAIVILSALICICGIFYIYLNNFTQIDPGYVYQSEVNQRNFTFFEEEMVDAEVIMEVDRSEENISPKKRSSKSVITKLELGQTIDINSVSKQILTRVPGIGDTFAERIVEYRNSLGGFVSLEQLTEIKGVTINKYSKILPYLILKGKHKHIRINKASEKDMLSHPYFNEDQIRVIIDIRRKEKISSIEILQVNDVFSSRDINRILPYLSFE